MWVSEVRVGLLEEGRKHRPGVARGLVEGLAQVEEELEVCVDVEHMLFLLVLYIYFNHHDTNPLPILFLSISREQNVFMESIWLGSYSKFQCGIQEVERAWSCRTWQTARWSNGGKPSILVERRSV